MQTIIWGLWDMRDIYQHMPPSTRAEVFENNPVTITFLAARLEQAGRAVHFPNAFVIVVS
jgi:hypothetical protein